MSGVAAIFHRDESPLSPETLARVASGIASRGEHGLDLWRAGPLGLAHSHFWSTPEEVGERQPISSRDGRLRVCADLRLDNRDELCAALRDAVDGPASTDAQILLAAYERWGEDCPRHLVGDFAFALWDVPRRRLFLARDPLGVRPLYYALNDRRLIAASTLEAVLVALEEPVEVNEPFLRDLVAWQLDRWVTETPYRGVLRLPPAHRMMVEEGQAAASRYWTLGEDPPPPLSREEEHIERFREIFLAAVKAHLRSTGPVGFLVSGGLDSSAVACASDHLLETGALSWHTDLRLYSCVFERTPGAEERAYAEAVAQRCSRARTTLLASDDCCGLREFAGDDGYPLAEPEIGINRALMFRPLRAARADGCRVVLTGIGGDQVLGGEPYHTPVMLRDIEWSRLAAEIPHFQRWSRCGTASLLFDAYVRPAVPAALRRLSHRLLRTGAARKPGVLANGQTPRPAPHLGTRAAQTSYRLLNGGGFSASLSSLSIGAAETGVEIRMPFLDRRVIELLLHTPARLRFRDGWIKLILRQSGLLPEEIRQRTSFAHFTELEHRGLRHEMRWRVRELLAGSRVVAAGLLEEAPLARAWEEYWQDTDPIGSRRTLIGFLSAEAWLRCRELGSVLPKSRPALHACTSSEG